MTAPQNPPTLSRAGLEADVAAVLAAIECCENRPCPRCERRAAALSAELAPLIEAHLLAAVAEAETALLARVAPIIEGGAA